MTIQIPRSGRRLIKAERVELEKRLSVGEAVVESNDFQYWPRWRKNQFLADLGAVEKRLAEDDQMRQPHSILESEDAMEILRGL